MRNQSWTQDGKLVQDIEIYPDGDKVMAKDHLSGITRPATIDEERVFLNQPESPRDLAAELDALKVRVEKLETK